MRTGRGRVEPKHELVVGCSDGKGPSTMRTWDERFYLGIHKPHWLGCLLVPACVSRNALAARKRLPRAQSAWVLDSGGFSELSLRGAWTVTAEQYVSDVRRFAAEIGNLVWAAIQDYMCEPWIVLKTGLSIAEHQRRTVASYLDLLARAPELPWLPVLQGWTVSDYLRHVDDYTNVGVDLSSVPVVGVGSICRRQRTSQVQTLLTELAGNGLRLHGFGVKLHGLARCSRLLHSADSMAWSYAARREPPIFGHQHKSCANCLEYAIRWRHKVLLAIRRVSMQQELFPIEAAP